MTTLEKFQELSKIKFVEYDGDMEIGTLETADGYEIHFIGETMQLLHDERQVFFQNNIFYYKPDFDTIMEVIGDYHGAFTPLEIACNDIEEYFDEYDMLNYLESEMDEEEFEKFTNEKK
jgi:hypothetical protein